MIAFSPNEDHLLVRDMVRQFAQGPLTKTPPDHLHLALRDRGLWNLTGSPDSGGSQMDWQTTLLVLEELARVRAAAALRVLFFDLSLTLLPPHERRSSLTIDYLIPGAQNLALRLGADDTPHWAVDPKTYAHTKLTAPAPWSHASWMGLEGLPLVTVAPPTSPWITHNQEAPRAHDAAMALGLGATALGLGQRAKHEALEYAALRTQFGKPLTAFQITQFKLATMATELDAAHVMLWQAASAMTQGQPAALDLALMANHQAIKAAFYAADEGLQLHGGYGYTQEYPIEHIYRDVQALSVLSTRQDALEAVGQRVWQQAQP